MSERLQFNHNLDDVIRKMERLAKKLDKVERSYDRATRSAKSFNNATRSGNRAQDAAAQKVNKTATATKRLADNQNKANQSTMLMGKLWQRFLAIGATRMLWQLGVTSAKTAAELDALGRAMEFSVGSKMIGQSQTRNIRAYSDMLGIAFQPATEGLTKLMAAARGTSMGRGSVRSLFQGLSKAIVTLGLNSEKAHGTFMAVEQIMSKGKVSAEELRRQLGDRIPGAFQIAARAMGVTTSKLDDMLKKGELMSEDFLPKFAKQLNEEFAEGWRNASGSMQAELNRMNNAWTDFKQNFGEVTAPAIKGFTHLIDALNITVENFREAIDGTPEWMKYLGDILVGSGVGGDDNLEKTFRYHKKQPVGDIRKDLNRLGMVKDTYGEDSEEYAKERERVEARILDAETEISNLISGWKSYGGFYRRFYDHPANYEKQTIEGLERDLEELDKLSDEFNGDGDGGKKGPKDLAGEMAEVHGKGNRILHINIGNIIENNNNNFVSGDDTQNERAAERNKDVLLEGLISTLQDLGQL